jgi:hypothetical protein
VKTNPHGYTKGVDRRIGAPHALRLDPPGGVGYGWRFWHILGDEKLPDRRYSWTGTLGEDGSEPSGSLVSPHGHQPFGAGWQHATCDRGAAPAEGTCTCGICLYREVSGVIGYVAYLNAPYFPGVSVTPLWLRHSVAVGRVETRGPWELDPGELNSGAYRVPAARIVELWTSPGALRSAEDLSDEYGVPVTGSSPTMRFQTWRYSLWSAGRHHNSEWLPTVGGPQLPPIPSAAPAVKLRA